MRSTRLCLSPLSPRTSSARVYLRPHQLLSSTCGATRKGIRNGKRTFTSSAARRQELEDHYKVMGLSPESTAGQIKARYYAVCLVIPRIGIGNAHFMILTSYLLIYGGFTFVLHRNGTAETAVEEISSRCTGNRRRSKVP